MSDHHSYDAQLDAPVWGAKGIAQVLNRTVRQAYHLLESGHVDADKVGKTWRSSIRRLLTPQDSK